MAALPWGTTRTASRAVTLPARSRKGRHRDELYLTREQALWAAREYRLGARVVDLAKRLGVAEGTIRRTWRVFDCKPARPAGAKFVLTREQAIEAARLVEFGGVTIKQAAEQFHVAYNTLLDTWAGYGVLPPPGQRCPRCRHLARVREEARQRQLAGHGAGATPQPTPSP
jgi:transposase-like protein